MSYLEINRLFYARKQMTWHRQRIIWINGSVRKRLKALQKDRSDVALTPDTAIYNGLDFHCPPPHPYSPCSSFSSLFLLKPHAVFFSPDFTTTTHIRRILRTYYANRKKSTRCFESQLKFNWIYKRKYKKCILIDFSV